MLIEFKVANFRSIREEQKISLVAAPLAGEPLSDSIIQDAVIGTPRLRLLKSVGIYGANATGKSNAIVAIPFLRQFIRNAFRKLEPGQPTGATPFVLDEQSRSEPCCFEVTFIHESIRYTYRIEFTDERVTSEFLGKVSNENAIVLFKRAWDAGAFKENWSFESNELQRDEKLVAATRPNCPFLSSAAQFNTAAVLPAYEWFRDNLHWGDLAMGGFDPSYSIEQIHEGELKDAILSLIRKADFGIVDAHTSAKNLTDQELSKLPKHVADEVSRIPPSERRVIDVDFLHQAGSANPVPLPLEEQSRGTQRYLSLAGPWLDTLRCGYTLILDELDTSLHPLLVVELLRLFNSEEHNKKGAQLIFTTHNPLLLHEGLLRPDQVWLADKMVDGATRLHALTDFALKQGEPIYRGYVGGRYGGIPRIEGGLL